MEVLIVLLVIAGVAVWAYFTYLGRQKRSGEMAVLATELGWLYRREEQHDGDEEYTKFEVFRHGHSRCADNTLVGKWKVGAAFWPVTLGDFHYQTTRLTGKRAITQTHHCSYIILQHPYGPLPELLVRRKGMFEAVKDLLDFEDVDFESGEFNHRFCVNSSDLEFAHEVIHPLMIEFLLGYEPPTIDLEAGSCLLTDGKTLWSPAEFRATLDWVRHFFELWPQHATSRLEHQTK